jgi:hypothetical protein
MATSVVYMKRHDTRPFLDVQLQDVDANNINVTAAIATEVKFTMKEINSTTIIATGACTILPATDLTKDNGYDGRVRYIWLAADTVTAGEYLGEFQITYTNGDKMTVPTSGTLAIVILEDYDNA